VKFVSAFEKSSLMNGSKSLFVFNKVPLVPFVSMNS